MSLICLCNHFYNILRLFDVLRKFPIATSETMRDYYFEHRKYADWIKTEDAHGMFGDGRAESPHKKKIKKKKTEDHTKSGNIKKVYKHNRMIT